MRTIKFRVWNKAKKEMVFVTSLNLTERTVMYVSKTNNRIFFIDEGDYELMQFIGIKTKNNKEIYEDDLCKQPNGKIIQVGMGTAYVDYIKQPLEIIGNIYENPELLKKE